MKTEVPSDKAAAKLHGHYQKWFVGDGSQTEFFLDKTVGRVEDVMAFVDGAVKRPDEAGTAYDYAIRGHTAGYDGDKNAIRFAVAPPNTKNVLICVISI